MRYADELRVMAELKTFHAIDVQETLQCPMGTAQSILSKLTDAGYLERVRVSREFLYTLSEKALRAVARLPTIDPQERCLQIEYVPGLDDSQAAPNCPNCGVPGEWMQWSGKDNGVYGKWKCLGCGGIVTYIDLYEDL